MENKTFEETTSGSFILIDWYNDMYEMQKVNTFCLSMMLGLLLVLIFTRKF